MLFIHKLEYSAPSTSRDELCFFVRTSTHAIFCWLCQNDFWGHSARKNGGGGVMELKSRRKAPFIERMTSMHWPELMLVVLLNCFHRNSAFCLIFYGRTSPRKQGADSSFRGVTVGGNRIARQIVSVELSKRAQSVPNKYQVKWMQMFDRLQTYKQTHGVS